MRERPSEVSVDVFVEFDRKRFEVAKFRQISRLKFEQFLHLFVVVDVDEGRTLLPVTSLAIVELDRIQKAIAEITSLKFTF